MKRLILNTAAVAVIAVGAFALNLSAQGPGEEPGAEQSPPNQADNQVKETAPANPLIEILAEKLGISTDELQQAFSEAREELQGQDGERFQGRANNQVEGEAPVKDQAPDRQAQQFRSRNQQDMRNQVQNRQPMGRGPQAFQQRQGQPQTQMHGQFQGRQNVGQGPNGNFNGGPAWLQNMQFDELHIHFHGNDGKGKMQRGGSHSRR